MSFLVGDCYVIQDEDPRVCSRCAARAECRDGADGKPTCFECQTDADRAAIVSKIDRARFCLNVPRGVTVTPAMIEQARQRAFG